MTFLVLAVVAYVVLNMDAGGDVRKVEPMNMGEARWSQARKLESLHPRMRAFVVWLLARLRREGFNPTVFYAWRSLETQAWLNRKGTGAAASYHTREENGQPSAVAVDIVDRQHGWGEGASEEAQRKVEAMWNRFPALAREYAEEHDPGFVVVWGGSWTSRRDPAHLEWRGAA